MDWDDDHAGQAHDGAWIYPANRIPDYERTTMTPTEHQPQRADYTPRRWTWLTPQLRAAIYTLMVAIGAVLALIGIVTPEQWDGATAIIDALLGILLASTSGLALAHTPKPTA